MPLRYVLGTLVFAFAALAQAQGYETFNQSSLARAAALPALGQGSVLQSGAVESGVTLDWNNEFFMRSTAREDLILDGETQRLSLRYQRGLGHGLEWSLELPLLFSGGGVLDGPIENWHSVFGLPNSNRSDAPRNRYRLRYVRDGVTVVDITDGNSGAGDVRIGAGWQLTKGWTLRALVQLPTGSRSQLSGGHAGAALWTDLALPLSDAGRFKLTLSAGASVANKSGPLSAQQRPLVAVAGAVLNVPLYGALDGVVQVNGHSKLYQGSTLAPLAGVGLPLLIGLRWPRGDLVFDVAISEDPSVDASPDFGLLFGVQLKTD